MNSSSSSLLPVSEAQARLLALATPVPAETLPIAAAAGRYAAADIVAQRTQPDADLSVMDGYAVRFADVPGPFRLIGESAAGRPFAGPIAPGQAARIFTGARMPLGADCVLVQEEALVIDGVVTMTGDGPSGIGGNVRRRGLDFVADDVLVSKGTRLTAARLALAAIGGHDAVKVGRRVRVAIAATGDELVPAGMPLAPGQLPESNGPMLAAMLADAPVELIDLGILPDRLEALAEAFGAVDADLILTSGGASVGDHDLVKPAIEAAGGSIDFWRIAMRPGKPLLAGRIGDTIIVGLPGNPVSAFVTALLFAKPLIAHLAGSSDPLPRILDAILGGPLPATGPRADYLRAIYRDGGVVPASAQDSSMLATLACADCLIVRPPHAPAVAMGAIVPIIPLA